jgi:hypothetical protein
MNKSKKILIRVTPAQKTILQAAAVKTDKTMSQIIRSQIDKLK